MVLSHGKHSDETPHCLVHRVRIYTALGWALFALVGLTFASLAANIYLISIPDPSDQVKALIDTFSLTWRIGVFAVAALLVGRGVFRYWPMGQ